MEILGVDIGGSGMKAGLVDISSGQLTTKRERIRTPQPATPEAMTGVLAELVERFSFDGTVGCTFPGVIRNQAIIETAANLDPSWVGVDAAALFSEAIDHPVVMANDADSAAVAEGRFGAAAGVSGVVLVITLGTGIGSGLLHNGRLVPNTELGHLFLDGVRAESAASARAKEAEDLTYTEWTPILNRYLMHVEALLWPDLIVLGGGISREFTEFAPMLTTRSTVVPATLRNRAGIIGAAYSASLSG